MSNKKNAAKVPGAGKKNGTVHDKNHKCVICGRTFKGAGNDPDPLSSHGRCCNFCNLFVALARIAPNQTKLYKVAATNRDLHAEIVAISSLN